MAGRAPEELMTVPQSNIQFNAPFLSEQPTTISVKNTGLHRIAWIVKGTNPGRYQVSPTTGVLKSGEQAIIRIVSASVDDYKNFAPSRDRITFEWLCPPDNDDSTVAKQQWFQSDTITRRKPMPIKWNM